MTLTNEKIKLFTALHIGPVWVDKSSTLFSEKEKTQELKVVPTVSVSSFTKKASPIVKPTMEPKKSILIAPTRSPVDVSRLSWEEMKACVGRCENCPELASTRLSTVYGIKGMENGVLLIGEAPGGDEDLQGIPFVGKSGQLLDNILKSVQLTRAKEVSIINVLKCRPPQNRNPNETEIDSCKAYLWRQIELLKPKIIILLGKIAIGTLLPSEANASIQSLRLKKWEYALEGRLIPLFVTYHPSYLLRSPTEKKSAWEDFNFALSFYR